MAQVAGASEVLDVTQAPTSAGRHATAPAKLLEFLVVGGLTPICFLLSWLLRRQLPLTEAELAVGFTFFHLAFVLNDPHFSVTYLLFYRDFRGRALGPSFSLAMRWRYWLAGVVIPLSLLGWSLLSLARASPQSLAFLFQLMLFLVGWHYVKQGFGVAVVLAGRRGVRFDQNERWVLLGHCYAAWIFSWVNPSVGAQRTAEKGVFYTAIARPAWLEQLAGVLLLISMIALVAMLVRKWAREGRLPLITPLTALLCSLWTWLIFSSVDPLVRYMTPALHSIQYLYFVWLLRRNEARARAVAPHFEVPRERLGWLAVSALGLGWLLFHGMPSALDDMFRHRLGLPKNSDLGHTPFFAALYASINIHHYFMDNVIWRRQNPETGLLYQD